MEQDPFESEFEVVRRLKHLSVRYKKGVKELRPMSEKLRNTIKEEILKDWEKEQKEKSLRQESRESKDREKEKKQREEEEQQRRSKKSKSNDQDNQQGHSH